jgi:hypothetical protein
LGFWDLLGVVLVLGGVEKIRFDFFTRFLMKYRHFYTTYMNIDKFGGKYFFRKKYFISIVLGEVVLSPKS